MKKELEELNGFKDLRIVDNFYQTSSFFPMPTTEIGTLSENGMTNLGSYSLCFPYYIAGKDYYAMVLCCRNSSNTAKNILRTGKCSINFIIFSSSFSFPKLIVQASLFVLTPIVLLLNIELFSLSDKEIKD